MDITRLREPDRYKFTHTVTINEWTPDGNNNNSNQSFYKSQSQPTEHSVEKGNGYVKDNEHRYHKDDRPSMPPKQNSQSESNDNDDDIPF